MIIDDLVVLARAVPELRPRGGGSKGVCLAGFSPTYGFIRIDPVRVDTKVRRWDILQVDVERKKRDTRHESWQIVNASTDWLNLNDRVDIVGYLKSRSERKAILEANLSSCVMDVSDAKDSLCLIRPVSMSGEWIPNTRYDEPYQTPLIPHFNEDWAYTRANFPQIPQITYVCPECKTKGGHHTQIFIGWDAFEFLRKSRQNQDAFWTNARFFDTDYDHYFLVGNQSVRRNAYMVIGVIWMKSSIQPAKENHKAASGFVYLIKDTGSGYTKIGLSVDAEARLGSLQIGNPHELELICKIPSRQPAKLETKLKSRFHDKHIRGEWYNLTSSDIYDIRKHAESEPTS